MGEVFTIGELARRAGVNVQTVRYYERRGLVLPTGRKRSGYRLYDQGALKRLRFIRHAKELGFTLEEIKELLELRADSAFACQRAKEKALEKLKDVERKIGALRSVEKVLKGLVDACNRRSPVEGCPILKAIEDYDDAGIGERGIKGDMR